MSVIRLGAGLMALSGGAAAMADSLNLSGGAMLGPDTSTARIEGRFFDQTEADSYGFFELRLGGESSDLYLRGSSADPRSFTRPGVSLRTGGTELEVGFTRSVSFVPGLSYSLGGSFLSTPAQQNPGVAYALNWSRPQRIQCRSRREGIRQC
jgi:hypothetical protein